MAYKMERFTAPEGFVYDYAVPRFDKDGNEEHLYYNMIVIGRMDNINNYVLIPDPKKEVKADGSDN